MGSKVRLREKRLGDALNDYSWRTDPELAQLDATPPLKTTFSEHLQSYAIELRHPSLTRCTFAVETLDGKHIGNSLFYGIDETGGETELGIMIGERSYWDKGYGTSAVTSLVDYIFRHTNLNRIYLKTLKSNRRAKRCFERCGFLPYGHLERDGASFVLMEIHRIKWREGQDKPCGQIKKGRQANEND